ncbi:MAG: Os1348 family NHLP clan protein [Candidatus Methylomirabilaceae bacterium]
MSQQAVEKALGKLVTDEGFREEFFSDPEPTSLQAGLDLSPEELTALFRIPRRALAKLGACIDDRICRLHVAVQPDQEEGAR